MKNDGAGRLMVEGKVEHKFDMKPRAMDNDEYRKICRERMTKSMVKTRTLQVRLLLPPWDSAFCAFPVSKGQTCCRSGFFL